MRLHLGGHLDFYDSQKRSWVDVSLGVPTRLLDVLAKLGVPEGEVAIVSVNGRAVAIEEAIVSDADRVEIFPPVGGGSG